MPKLCKLCGNQFLTRDACQHENVIFGSVSSSRRSLGSKLYFPNIMDGFYINVAGKNQGPFTPSQLREQQIAGRTPVWREGWPQWLYAEQVPDLANLISAPPESYPPASPPTPPPLPPHTLEPPTNSGAQSLTIAELAKPAPRLWSPNAVASWSLLFSPLFGSILLVGLKRQKQYAPMERQRGLGHSDLAEWRRFTLRPIRRWI
jgi:hypothetical protein